jgi:hypothetical protein
LWSVSKALRIPFDPRIEEIKDIPYTLSFLVRKNLQVDGLSELSRDKRPPEKMLWYGAPEEVDDWLDRALGVKKTNYQNTIEFEIDEGEIG